MLVTMVRNGVSNDVCWVMMVGNGVSNDVCWVMMVGNRSVMMYAG